MTIRKPKTDEITSTRDAILNATEEIMLTEGYSAVSSRRVASKAGFKSKLMHHYFRSMDDLFIAAFQRLEDKYDARFSRAVASEHAIRQLWRLSTDAARTGLILEFMALATHRPAIRLSIARSAKRDRTMFAAALAGFLERRGARSTEPSPAVLAMLMASVARALVTERALGVTETHAEMMAFVEAYLTRIGGHSDENGAPHGSKPAKHVVPRLGKRVRRPSKRKQDREAVAK